jgi:hypothetical protein
MEGSFTKGSTQKICDWKFWKRSHGPRHVQIDNVTTCTCLQALVSVPKSIQRAIVVGGFIVTLVDFIVDGDVGMIDNNVDS